MKNFTLVKFASGSEEPLACVHILLRQFEVLGLYFVGFFHNYASLSDNVTSISKHKILLTMS